MAYTFLRSLWLPISQVSHSGPPVPLHLPPSTILLSSCSQPALPLFPHHSTHKSTYYISFYTPYAPQLHSSLPCLLSLHFGFIFCDYLWLPMLLAPLPTSPHHIGLISHAPHPLHDPSHSLTPACLPTYLREINI